MNNKILILNMKMYMDIDDVNNYLDKIKTVPDNVVLCPESIYIPYFLKQYKNISIQSIYPANSGAYTGCISPNQVKKMGVNYAVVGHSECRKYFSLSDIDINTKVKSALENNLNVILCIGETLEEKEAGMSFKKIKEQLDTDLNGVVNNNIIIAYEPIYSIGTGKIPTNSDIIDTIIYIKSVLKKKNLDLKVLYGGSVNSTNINDLIKIKEVDGFMVGKSSSIVDEVEKMIKVVSC